MNAARKKLIGGSILLLLFSAVFCGFLTVANSTMYLRHSFDVRTAQINAIQETLKNVNQEGNAAVEEVLTRRSRRIALYVAVSGDEIIKESGGKPCCLQKGAVIRVSDGQIELPEGFPEDIIFDADAIIGDIGVAYSHPLEGKDGDAAADSTFYFINYNRLEGSLYYIEWSSESEIIEEMHKYYASGDSLSGIENAFDVRILLFSPDPDSDGNHEVYYRSDDLPEYRTAEEYGITEEMISHRIRESDETTFSDYLDEFGMLNIDGAHYELMLQEWTSASMGETCVNAYLITMEKASLLMREQILLVLAVFFMIGVFLIVWFHATMVLVKKHVLSDNQKKELDMRTISRRTVSITGIGALSVFLVALILMSLFRLFSTCRQVDAAFASLRQGIEENSKLVSTAMESQMGMYKQY
ncbi:MAG: hypothetical protein Q4G47_06710, partial [Lachnospiraceae bacterium]|nr:hypothetical protein [Lachnospiraceae bacterium]